MLPNSNTAEGKNCYNCLNLDIFLSLFAFLDTISLLNFQAADKFSRLITEHSPIWLDRWMWRNRKLQDSLPRGFFNDYTSLKFENEDLKARRHQRSYGSKTIREKNKLERDGKKKLKFAEIIDINNTSNDFFNTSAHVDEKVCFRNTESAKIYKKDFSLLRNVDVTIIQLILQVVEGVRPLSDLTEYFLHTTFKFLSTNSLAHFMESYHSFQAKGNGNRYFHSIYLLTVIIDRNSDTYSQDFRLRFLRNILGDCKYRGTMKKLSLDEESSKIGEIHDNKTVVDVILSSPSIQNVARLTFLFLRSQLQYFKWNEMLHLHSPSYNRDLKSPKVGGKIDTTRHEGVKEDVAGDTGVKKILSNNADNMINNISNGDKTVSTKIEENSNVEVEERFSICEAFMILADSKSTEDQHFCDRAFTKRVIDKLVFMVHEKIFQNAVYDFDIDILRSRVSRMDRTYVRHVILFYFPNMMNIDIYATNTTIIIINHSHHHYYHHSYHHYHYHQS